jgi:hypothetical protein
MNVYKQYNSLKHAKSYGNMKFLGEAIEEEFNPKALTKRFR